MPEMHAGKISKRKARRMLYKELNSWEWKIVQTGSQPQARYSLRSNSNPRAPPASLPFRMLPPYSLVFDPGPGDVFNEHAFPSVPMEHSHMIPGPNGPFNDGVFPLMERGPLLPDPRTQGSFQ